MTTILNIELEILNDIESPLKYKPDEVQGSLQFKG